MPIAASLPAPPRSLRNKGTDMKLSIASVLTAAILFTSPALGAGAGYLKDHEFSFDGMFGAYDQGELQRGYQIYEQVCAACHGMKHVPFRTLAAEDGPGFGDAEVKAIAANFEVADEEGDPGDTRPAKPFDYFPTPMAGGNPPDMSLLAKARAGGALYIYSILLGYTGEEKEVGGAYLYENKAYGGYFGMAQPLYAGDIEYSDGTPETLEQYSNDLSAFLMWTAEPKLVERKQAGVWSMGFLILFATLVWFTNRKVWARVKHPKDHA